MQLIDRLISVGVMVCKHINENFKISRKGNFWQCPPCNWVGLNWSHHSKSLQHKVKTTKFCIICDNENKAEKSKKSLQQQQIDKLEAENEKLKKELRKAQNQLCVMRRRRRPHTISLDDEDINVLSSQTSYKYYCKFY